ncbi:hypothetical protein NXS19_001414 [Fusarium pseudograminearum]|nr:hypothetical protein NXS19_001414 [Fusarium pseudograminearum]
MHYNEKRISDGSRDMASQSKSCWRGTPKHRTKSGRDGSGLVCRSSYRSITQSKTKITRTKATPREHVKSSTRLCGPIITPSMPRPGDESGNEQHCSWIVCQANKGKQ